VPTISGDAPIDRAYSDTVTRLPASAEWLTIASAISTGKL
jgi:hypothetical protein